MTLPDTTAPIPEAKRKATDCDPRALAFELLHALSQPLTALSCSLELALQRPLTPEACREIVSRSLAQAERASWLTMAIRELFDAGQPGENCEALDLQMEVIRAIGDVALVAEAAGVKIVCLPWPAGEVRLGEVRLEEARVGEARVGEVWFDELRLRRALFNLLGFVVGSCSQGSLVELELGEAPEQLTVKLTVPCADTTVTDASASDFQQRQKRDELAQRLGLGIARATFEAAGGSLQIEDRAQGMNIQIRIPRAAKK